MTRAIANDRLDRLHWLSSQGVRFSFAVTDEMKALKKDAPEWTSSVGDRAADPLMSEVFSITTDENPAPLLDVPISEIITHAHLSGSRGLRDRVQPEPFRGLASRRPCRALGALTDAARHGDVPRRLWADFLHADGRVDDPLRMITVIARRIERHSLENIRMIVYPVSEWMEKIADRLYGDAAHVLPDLWNRVVDALASSPQERRGPPNRSWADEALNSPVGRLVDLLLKDPSTNGLDIGVGFPRCWTDRAEQLLALPDTLRRYALVLISRQLPWLYTIDPRWTEERLLRSAEDLGDDGDAFWSGILWAGRAPGRELFLRLKPAFAQRAAMPSIRRSHGNILAGILLFHWGDTAENDPSERVLTDDEFREILIHADDELRGHVIWNLEQWFSNEDRRWRDRILPFLRRVWPKQRALRNPNVTARLTDLAISSGDLMPEIVKALLPRLVPLRGPTLHTFARDSEAEDHPARRYPRSTLDLLMTILAEDPGQWPYGTEDVLQALAEAPETAADPRLSELRRRQEWA